MFRCSASEGARVRTTRTMSVVSRPGASHCPKSTSHEMQSDGERTSSTLLPCGAAIELIAAPLAIVNADTSAAGMGPQAAAIITKESAAMRRMGSPLPARGQEPVCISMLCAISCSRAWQVQYGLVSIDPVQG